MIQHDSRARSASNRLRRSSLLTNHMTTNRQLLYSWSFSRDDQRLDYMATRLMNKSSVA